MNINLPEHVERSIHSAVQSGRFASVDDAMTKAALLLLEQLKQVPPVSKQPTAAQEPPADARKPIWEEILELTADVPDEEWDKLPTDLAEQHDHYIYGTPKRPTT